MSSRFITVLPVIAAIVLLMSALGLVARVPPRGVGEAVTGQQHAGPPGASCPVSEEAGVDSTPNRSRRRLL